MTDEEWHEWRGCAIKKAYSSLPIAEASRRRQRKGKELYPYRCRFCGCYHLATKKPSRRRKSYAGTP